MTTSEGRLAAVPEAGGAPAARPAIETRGLTKRYPRVTALSDCSISVPAAGSPPSSARMARARPRCCGCWPASPARPAARRPSSAAGGAGAARQISTYQPISRYRAFQSIETAIFLALAAGLVAVAFAVVRRHDA